jgi:hypothetical protein
MRWMVIYEYEVPGGALKLNCTKLPRSWSPRGSSPSRKNPHGRTRNRPRDLMISSQKLWPLDHEAGLKLRYWDMKIITNWITAPYSTSRSTVLPLMLSGMCYSKTVHLFLLKECVNQFTMHGVNNVKIITSVWGHEYRMSNLCYCQSVYRWVRKGL